MRIKYRLFFCNITINSNVPMVTQQHLTEYKADNIQYLIHK